LQEELVRAEAQEADRRHAAEALEQERLTRLVELARLEEEATRARSPTSGCGSPRRRGQATTRRGSARRRGSRASFANPEGTAPLGPAAAEVIGRPLPPPTVLPPIPPLTRAERRSSPLAPTKPRNRMGHDGPAYPVGASPDRDGRRNAALSITGDYFGQRAELGTSSDIAAWLLTPACCPRRPQRPRRGPDHYWRRGRLPGVSGPPGRLLLLRSTGARCSTATEPRPSSPPCYFSSRA
jgi:hypothetical protein